MTEAAHQMASNPLPPGVAQTRERSGTAGGPEVAILDETGHVLPPGATGEVAIRGPSVIAGLREQSGRERRRRSSTDGSAPATKGASTRTATCIITGRLKEIINRGGEKVAPREIDEALLEHADVGEAAAFAIPHDAGRRRRRRRRAP